MLKSGHSLWDQVPSTSRLELIPIVTTGFLAQAGSLTAALFVRLGGGTPYGQAPNPVAVNDLTGLFIFANSSSS
jgi:hypothetical protein